MIAQRPAGAAPVVQACAEALPFRNGSFDAVLGILTVHHWEDQAKGFSECVRLARSRVVFATNDFDVCAKFWLFDYFPELLRADRHIFPSMARFVGALGESGAWQRRYPSLEGLGTLDLGYRIVIARRDGVG